MTSAHNQPKKWSVALPLSLGFGALFLLFALLGLWGTQARISGAVIATGIVQVENNRQIVQHPTGGVVGAILAKDGAYVEAGSVVVRLDDSALVSELAVIEGQLNEIAARKARLIAERDDFPNLVIPEVFDRETETKDRTLELFEGQVRLFDARKTSLLQELARLEEQIAQTENQIKGTEAQVEALQRQNDLIDQEVGDAETLLSKGLVHASHVSTLLRDQAKLAGDKNTLVSDIARLRGQIAALEIEGLRLRSSRREDAISSLRDLEFREIELIERRISVRDTREKLSIRAPVSGVIYGSRIFALQSVISPAEAIMFIIPQGRPMLISAKIESIHIDQIKIGQVASLRFSAFDQRVTPELFGIVSKISADVFIDESSGMSFYQIELIPTPEELAKLDGQQLLPGMPVEAFIKTAERSPLSYLIKPLADYFRRAFRET